MYSKDYLKLQVTQRVDEKLFLAMKNIPVKLYMHFYEKNVSKKMWPKRSKLYKKFWKMTRLKCQSTVSLLAKN